MRALVIQDRQVEGINVADVFSEEGFVVDQLEDPLTVGLFYDHPYAICVIDLDTPGFDGLRLVQQWKSRQQRCPILAVSAAGGWLAKIKAMEAGADDYLVKPIIFGTLLQKIYSAILASNPGAKRN